MSERQTIVLNYTPLESGNAESRWIRVEQETPEDESLTVAEAAALIDSIYEIEACDDGMGGGGEGDDGTDAPDEDKVDAALAAMLDRAGMCDEAKFWTATVRVYRSHRQPGYVLRSETATVETTEPVRESRRQEVEVSGAVIELDMPYDGGLTGIPAGVRWEVRGSTVNLDRPVNGRLVLRYTTYYERVTLRVPNSPSPAGSPPGGGALVSASLLEGGGGEVAGGEKPARPELQAAAVVAFWGDLAASCDLNPPEQDDADANAVREQCRKGGGGSGGGGDDPGECWKTVAHYDRCSCSYKKVNEWEEQVPAPCDGAISGAGVGYEERFGGFVWCEGEEDEVSDPEYYEKRCCHPPPRPLPRCRKSYAVYTGGHEIENGPDHWRNIYGADVAMIAVMPDGGTCGEVVTEWNVPQKNCCDDVEPQEPHPDNPKKIAPGGAVKLVVNGGQNPRKWRASAGLTFFGGKNYLNDGGSEEWVYASNDACDVGSVQVDDGCTKIHMPLLLDAGERPPMRVYPDGATIAPGQRLLLSAENSRGDVQWESGALRLVSPQGRTQATFEAPDDFCGMTEVTATDACGNADSVSVLSTMGAWKEVFDFDPCSAPWGGRAPSRASGPCLKSCRNSTNFLHYVDNYQGYRAYVCNCSGGKSYPGGQISWPPPDEGSCSDSLSNVDVMCGYSGNELIGNQNGESLYQCTPNTSNWSNAVRCYTLCTHNWDCSQDAWGRVLVGQNIWGAMVHSIERLWRWDCAE